ncbi:membrane protein insertase YidC [Betaproteobacteria bacterium SCN1]|jgi:YidC/Oxa1 family membrane protein insertase|nr:membrane protein insertase YidC [Betaproteobacteria bacterium SCN1]MBN8760035.1 membrane protein insertase YidC [Thiobacillus sp.]ODU90837.1 MAG: membrane protein insertase YidC [Thiobacillus sp. SCN 65-179]OJW35739.1 MAG: membrane protein insertase YidC [Thiobacillus sp. 65-69]
MDNQRLILFIVFSFSLLLLWESWQSRHAPTPAPTPAAQSAAVPGAAPTPSQALNAPAAPAPAVAAFARGVRAVAETDVLRATIDANGGDLRMLQLLPYRETDDKKQIFELFEDDESGRPYIAQSGLIGKDMPTHRSVYQLNAGTYRLTNGAARLEVPLVWDDAATGVRVEKTYIFKRGSYEIDVRTRVINRGTQPVDLTPYYQFTRHGQPPRGESIFIHSYTGPAFYTDAKKFQKVPFKSIEEGKADFEKNASDGWASMVQHHFVAAWLPQGAVKREFYVRALGEGQYTNGVILAEGTLAPGQEKTFTVPLYAGPQIQETLEATAPGLDLSRDYGWLKPLAFPIFWALEKLEGIVGNWGWAIIILTIAIKLLMYPLSAASYKSMAKMKKLTPRLQQLKEAYGDDRAKLHQAMAEMYKTEKINPLGGCLPILIQIPVFIALYWVLLAAVEMRGAPWVGWITDLTAPDPWFILPIVMGITSILQVKLNPQPMDPMQAKIMMIMPVAFTVMFVFFPAGLVLYWVVNNILSIAQQWAINRQVEGGGTAAAKKA